MRGTFLSNLFLLLLLNLIVKPFWLLGVDREVQNMLGQEEYGAYFALLNFSILFSSLLDLGISSYNNRNIAQHQFLLGKYFPKLINIKAALSGVYVLVVLLSSLALGYRGDKLELLLILAFNQSLISLILFLRSNLTALLLFRRDSFISVADKILLIAFCGTLILYRDGEFLTVKNFVLAQSLAYGITVLLAFSFLVRRIKFKKISFRPQGYLAIIKESYPFAILVFLMAIYSRTDAIMLERLLPDGATQSGIYAQGYRILEAFSMIAYLFSTLLLPLFSKMLKEGSGVGPLVQTALKLLGVFALGIAVLASFNAEFIIQSLYDSEIEKATQVFKWLIFSLIPISSTYIFGTLLTAAGKLRFLNQMAISGVFLNLILNFLLIPSYQAEGAVYATLATQGITALVQVLACFRFIAIDMAWKVWLKLAAFVLLCVSGLLLVEQYFSSLSALIAGAVLVPLLGVLLGILNPKSVLELLKSGKK
ncbi:MAG: oligosaccharide flippase family protein [Luteibaculum sp.]